jgi:cell division transport system permease protein
MSLLFKGRPSGANVRKQSLFHRIRGSVINHIRQILASLGELWRTPMASVMTIAVLGLSITLPSTLYILVKNSAQVTSSWEQAGEITLFLKPNTSLEQAETTAFAVKIMPEIQQVQLIPAEQALADFEQKSGLTNTLSYLEKNPLPHVLIVTPEGEYLAPSAAKQLLVRLERQQHVAFGKLDIEWLTRLTAILSVASDIVWIVALLLCVSVVLIIGNTIRLNILNQREEIIVMKLVGATDNFIRFPFLYTGVWYGLLGGLLAWFLVVFILWWIQSGIEQIVILYQSDFVLNGIDAIAMSVMLSISVLLGLLGSFISVQKHIKAIEPK